MHSDSFCYSLVPFIDHFNAMLIHLFIHSHIHSLFSNHLLIKHLLGISKLICEFHGKAVAVPVLSDKPAKKTPPCYPSRGSLQGAVEGRGKHVSPPSLFLRLGSLSAGAAIFPQRVACCHLLRSDQWEKLPLSTAFPPFPSGKAPLKLLVFLALGGGRSVVPRSDWQRTGNVQGDRKPVL